MAYLANTKTLDEWLLARQYREEKGAAQKEGESADGEGEYTDLRSAVMANRRRQAGEKAEKNQIQGDFSAKIVKGYKRMSFMISAIVAVGGWIASVMVFILPILAAVVIFFYYLGPFIEGWNMAGPMGGLDVGPGLYGNYKNE